MGGLGGLCVVLCSAMSDGLGVVVVVMEGHEGHEGGDRPS